MQDYIGFIKKCWTEFTNEGILNELVRKEISDSWMRCKKYGVDSMNGKGNNKYNVDVKIKAKENAELISVSKPIMKSLYNIVAGTEFGIILTDKEGYVLDVIGDEIMLERMQELNFVKGALWNEKIVGTNAIGTALHLDKPIQTIGAEHYCLNQHSWTCSCSTIHDEDGNIIGAINMSGNYYNAHPHTLGIVTSAAKSIQKQLALTISNKLMNITFNSIFEGMLVLDKNFKIKRANNRGLNILKAKINNLLNVDINKILKDINFREMIYDKDKTFSNVECDFCIESIYEKCKSRDNKNCSLIIDYKNKKTSNNDDNNNYSKDHNKGNNKDYKNDESRKFIKCLINAVPMKVNEKLFGVVITFRENKYVHRLVNKVVGYRANYTFKDIITNNTKMKEIIEFAKKIAKSDCNILIEGQSGTGKELVAQSIHNYSNRRNGPFVAVNCASIPRELVESELFGYEKGAFTGASKEGHPGKFELADGGSIFLDEIGELPLDIQSKLLRVLDNNKITRIGATYEKQLNVRVIGATNRSLKNEIEKKSFREDLYYRLSVMNVKTMPLNERKDDIELLANYFVNMLNDKNKNYNKKLSKKYVQFLLGYNWRGNVRELRNAVERDYYLSDKEVIEPYNIEEKRSVKNVNYEKSEKDKNEQKLHEVNALVEPISDLESQAIENALVKCRGNRVKAAKLLGIGRSTLYRKIKKYNIIVK
ncbi:sigma-54-dependent Fis family transcriptional regulator [Haloimpatiens sp. FM7315]|uniref:sigma-54-dependent Fis family transcriptional regulator n=1 Tax=Haloimpatiens sp. FM7315 TaxID=3298609 RepID=UPI00370B816A